MRHKDYKVLSHFYARQGQFVSPMTLGFNFGDACFDLARSGALERKRNDAGKWLYRHSSEFKMKILEAQVIGSSSDNRSNLWQIECPKCRYNFRPRSTMLAVDYFDCDKCGEELLMDYNGF